MGSTPKYEIIVAERARRLLTAHIRFLSQVSPSAARTEREQLTNGIRSLSLMPERFPFFNTDFIIPNKYHKMFIEKWWLVLYQIKDRTVYVDYILDCRQDNEWLVR